MTSLFRLLFSPAPEKYEAHTLSIALTDVARNPFFYEHCAVPDTLDGRFDMLLVVHFLALERLRTESGTEAFQQALMECFFSTLDRSLREMGVGDMGVGKRIRNMADACKGRLARYRSDWADADARKAALTYNLYRGNLDAATRGLPHLLPALDALVAQLRQTDMAGLRRGELALVAPA